jgi:arylsulfatase A-like enzyme
VLVVAALLVLGSGCGSDQAVAQHSLLASFELATFLPVETVVELHHPPGSSQSLSDADDYLLKLGQGWSRIGQWGTWATGARSTIEARLPVTGARFLYLECRPSPGRPDDPQQAVTVTINGTECGTVELQQGWHEYWLAIDQGLLRPGLNEIGLGYRYHRSPHELGHGQDRRQLAGCFRKLGLVRKDEPSHIELCHSNPIAVDYQRRRVTVTRPGRVMLPLSLPAGPGRLVLAAALALPPHQQPSGPVRLGLSLLDPDGQEHELAAAAAGTGIPTPEPASESDDLVFEEQSIDLPATGEGLGFLLLDAGCVTAGETRLVLAEPRLERAAVRQRARPPATSPAPDMVVLILDAARADHFGCYGYHLPTTPNIDRFAAESLVFEYVITHASYTTCSVPTMVTGLPFTRHGLVTQDRQISDEITTLAEHLHDRGYVTVGMTANPHHCEQRRLNQGYDEWLETWQQPGEVGRKSLSPHILTDLALTRLAQGFGDRPFFMLLHYIPPHAPYIPPQQLDIFGDPGYQGVFRGGLHEQLAAQRAYKDGKLAIDAADQVRLMSLYDGNLLRVDDAVGRLLSALQARSRWSDTVVLITSDHGEGFYEHGMQGHSYPRAVYDEMLRVPFILHLPRHLMPEPGQVDRERLASLADIVPTLLGLIGSEPGAEVTGADLLAPGTRQDLPAWVISRGVGRQQFYSISTSRYKLIAGSDHQRELYHLVRDPGETRNLAGEAPLMTAGLSRILEATLAQDQVIGTAAGSVPLTEEQRKALEVLGYIAEAE